MWTHRLLSDHLRRSGLAVSASQVGRILACVDLKPHLVRGHGTVSIIAALNVHTGQVLTERIDRNNADTFIGFLRQLNESITAGTSIHLVIDDGSSPHREEDEGLAGHPSPLQIHHTPEHASRLNQVELFFSTLTRRLLRRGQFASRDELAAAIETFVLAYDEHDAKPYRWTYDGSPLKAA